MADKPKTVFLTGETHKRLKAESVRRGEKLKETAENVVTLGMGFITHKSDLYQLAKKASNLNPDAGEIGEGMLRQLVDLANRVLGKEVAR